MQIIYLNVWLPLTCIVCLCWILKYLMNHQNIAIIKSTIRQCRIFVCGVFSFKIQHFAFAITKAGTLLSRASYLICAGKSVRPVLGSNLEFTSKPLVCLLLLLRQGLTFRHCYPFCCLWMVNQLLSYLQQKLAFLKTFMLRDYLQRFWNFCSRQRRIAMETQKSIVVETDNVEQNQLHSLGNLLLAIAFVLWKSTTRSGGQSNLRDCNRLFLDTVRR